MKKYIKPAFEIIELQGERMLASSPNDPGIEDATVADSYTDSNGATYNNLFSNEKQYSSSDIWKNGE